MAWTSPVLVRVDEHAAQAEVPVSSPQFFVVHGLRSDHAATDSAQLDEALRAGRVTTSRDMNTTGRPPVVEWHAHEIDIQQEE